MQNNIFVYGTLRLGEGRNAVLSDCTKLPGTWTIKGTLVSLGAFPAFSQEGDTTVVGEVYVLPEDEETKDLLIRRLDGIEGVAYGLYKKSDVVATNGIKEILCTVYEAGPKILNKWDQLTLIPSGDWLEHVNSGY